MYNIKIIYIIQLCDFFSNIFSNIKIYAVRQFVVGYFPYALSRTFCFIDEQPARSQVTHGGGFRKPRAQCIFSSWKYAEHFTYKFIKGRNISVQCEMCLPANKLLSASKDSTSNLKKHLEVSLSQYLKG